MKIGGSLRITGVVVHVWNHDSSYDLDLDLDLDLKFERNLHLLVSVLWYRTFELFIWRTYAKSVRGRLWGCL